MRHSFRVMEELGAECDRLRVRVVDVHGETGSASDFLAKVARYIEAREKELHDRRWIPVTERLPEPELDVLAYAITEWEPGWPPQRMVTCHSGTYWYCDSMTVTHWMKLPAPPDTSK